MSDPDGMLDTEELEYSLNSDFEETQEMKYSMELSTNSSENTWIFLLLVQKIQTPN